MTSIDFENVKMYSDRVVLRLEKTEETVGGVLLHSLSHENVRRCTVMAVGPGRMTKKDVLIEPDIKVGDLVLLKPEANSEKDTFRADGKDYIACFESDILAIVD